MTHIDDDGFVFIRTKLQRPRLAQDLIPRPQLIRRLNQGVARKLTLVSAQAGAGKSTLLSQWLEQSPYRSAWLSLDETDNDLAVFTSYLCAAIQTTLPEGCQGTLDLLKAPVAPPARTIAASVVNELIALCENCRPACEDGGGTPCLIMTLDDYHIIDEPAIHELMAHLVAYLPPCLHLTFSTRVDPQLPLAKLRAQGDMNEFRTSELQLTSEESQALIEVTAGKKLANETLELIREKTEGWVVGVRLAGLSIRDLPDDGRLTERLAGNSGSFIADYMMSEMLSQQPAPIQDFLLRSSILKRFNAELCDAVLYQEEDALPDSSLKGESLSHALISDLRSANMLLLALNRDESWFRYHHLFRDLLQHRFHHRYNVPYIRALHRRASRWFEAHGFLDEALAHAFSSDDLDSAAGIVARKRHDLMNQTRWQRLSRYLDRFPEQYVSQRPDLLMLRTWLVYHDWRYDLLPAALGELAEAMGQSALEPEVAQRLEGEASAQASLLSYFSLDPDRTIAQAHFAIDNTPLEAWNVRILARLTLAAAYQMKGDLDRAYHAILGASDQETTKDERLQATALMASCFVYWVAADLNGLAQVADQCLAILKTQRAGETERFAHYHLGCVQLYRNNLAEAARHFAVVTNQPHLSYGECFVFSAVGLACTLWAQNHPDEARATIEGAVTFILETGNIALLQVAKAFEIELALREGNLEAARQWAASFDSDRPVMPMPYLYNHEFTLIRIWLVQDTRESRQRADDLLGRLRHYAESFHNKNVLISVLLLSGMVHDANNNRPLALDEVERAVVLAQPGGIIWPFVDLGPPMARLLTLLHQRDVERGCLNPHLAKIVSALEAGGLVQRPEGDRGPSGPAQAVTELLTPREMEVLELLAQRLTNKEIAQRLTVSTYTVKSHTLSIYAKLDVHGRRQAVDKARELGFLTL